MGTPDMTNVGFAAFVRDELWPAMCEGFRTRRQFVVVLAILVLGILLRTVSLDQPMRADEASTFIMYVKGSLAESLTYLSPNNHVLHTLLAKAATTLWGTSPAAIRIPALLFGCTAIVLSYCASRSLGNSGYAAALIVAVSPYMILFSTNARGYTLLVCCTLMLVIVAELLVRNPSRGATTTFAMIAALGMLTMPTMAFPLAGLFVWMAWRGLGPDRNAPRTAFIHVLLICGLKSIAFTIVLYAPIVWLSGLRALVSNEFVQSQDLRTFAFGMRWHVESTVVQFLRDMPPGTLSFLVVICGLGLWRSLANPPSRLVSLWISMILGAAILLIANHRIPFERTWIYFIPLTALIADAGMTVLGNLRSHIMRVLGIAGFAVAMTVPALRVASGCVIGYDDTGTYPDASLVAKLLAQHMREGDALMIPCCQNYPVFYYLWRFGAPAIQYGEPAANATTFFVVPGGVDPGAVLGNPASSTPWQRAGTSVIYRTLPQ